MAFTTLIVKGQSNSALHQVFTLSI